MRLLTAIILENENLSLNDLSSLQRMALKRVYHGKLDPDAVSERGMGVLDSLVDLGLLDMGYELTRDGQKAGSLIDKFDGEKRADRRDSSQLAAADMEDEVRRAGARKPRTHGTGAQFTEGELAAMRGAGLNEDEIAKLFEDDDKDEDKKDCECDCDCDCDKPKDDKKDDDEDDDKDDDKDDKDEDDEDEDDEDDDEESDK